MNWRKEVVPEPVFGAGGKWRIRYCVDVEGVGSARVIPVAGGYVLKVWCDDESRLGRSFSWRSGRKYLKAKHGRLAAETVFDFLDVAKEVINKNV